MRSTDDVREILAELSGFVGRLGVDKFLSLWSEDEDNGFSVTTVFAPSLFSPSARPSVTILTVLLSAPTALLAEHT